MLLLESILIAALSQIAPAAQNNGYLGGVVVRARDGQAAAGAEVVLSVRRMNEFVPVAKTVADEEGKFIFEELPVASHVIYKPGANWEGIHYPGPATQLTPSRSTVGVKLTVHEAINEPNPLVGQRLAVTIQSKPGMLEVSESLVVENPTVDCFVGKASEEGGEPQTLCLNIPSGFEQITFDKEFYGRGFSLSDGRLVTGVPWTPGVEELRYTYVLRNEQRQITWTRPLDLPCADVTVRIIAEEPEDVSCSLGEGRTEEPGVVVYHYSGPGLEAGREIRVKLGRTTVSPLAYGKWLAVTLLALLVVVTAIWRRRKGGSADASSSGDTVEIQAGSSAMRPHGLHLRGSKRRSVGSSE